MKRVLLTVFALTGALYACHNPVENVDVDLKTALPTHVELRFKPQTGVLPESVRIRIAGPDADKVVTVLNTKNFRVDDDGVLRLATVASVAPESERPLRFTVVATADNFLEVVQPVALSDNNQRTVPITLLGSGTGTSVAQVTAQSDAAGSLRNAVSLQTSGAATALAAVRIPQGTRLNDAADRPVEGNLTVRMQPITIQSAGDLPKGGVVSNATTASGNVMGLQQLTNIAGAVTLDIHNSDYQTVKTVSAPIRLSFAVNQLTINPATNARIKHGDAIPMFSYDAATDRWQPEAAGLIQTNSRTGQLECVAELPHLSTWTAAFAKPTCSDGATFSVKSNFKDYDVPFYCQVMYVDKNGEDLSVASSFYRTLIDGSDIAVTNLNQDASVVLKVYENPANLTKFVASSPVKSCGNGKTNLDLRSLKVPAAATAMTFTVQFPCKNVDDKKLPETVTAQFRETGTGTWQDLISLNRKDIKGDVLRGTTYKVTRNKRYDLRIKVLGFNFEQPNQLIDKTDWLVPFRGKDFCKK